MTKVLIIDIHAEIYRDSLHAEFPQLQFALARGPEETPNDLSDIDALICFGIAVNDSIIKHASKLKWIQSLATGVDHFLRCPSLKRETLITSGRGIHGAPMREQVIYMMMAISRDAVRAVGDQKAHFWERRLWSTLNGKTAAIAGTGIVGSAIGEALKALGMHVIGISRVPRQETGFDEMIATDNLADAAARADYLINMLPASEENLGVFGARIFGAMKPSAYYISAGRGQTVDEAALLDVLRARRIAGAALEVFQTEPLPPDSPFWDLPNVFITPHIGGYVIEYEELVLPLVIGNMRLFLAGRQSEMTNIVAR
jgi:phosphoglycerate dehydrogenase-like enzyme